MFVDVKLVLFTMFVIEPLDGTRVSYHNIPPYQWVCEPLSLVVLVFDILLICFFHPKNYYNLYMSVYCILNSCYINIANIEHM